MDWFGDPAMFLAGEAAVLLVLALWVAVRVTTGDRPGLSGGSMDLGQNGEREALNGYNKRTGTEVLIPEP
jgi:hypothetical protein